jgi:hypothetical protein
MPDCEICGKPYKSRSGLKAHRKTHAPAEQYALGEGPNYVGPSPSDDLTLDQIMAHANADRDVDLLAEACDTLSIHPDHVISFKVYPPHTVVIIQGPVGFKKTWTRGEEP